MKISVLGNSHVGSLKRAWDSINECYQNLSITFFASPSDSMGSLSIQGESLAPRSNDQYLLKNFHYTSGGLDCIYPKDFDLFIVYGLYFKFPLLDSRLSSAVLKCTCHDNYHNSLNFRIVEMIRELSESPIYIGHDPLNSKQIANQPYDVVSYENIIETTAAETHISKIHFIHQPSETVTNGWNTKSEYTINAKSLGNILVADNDTRHMNEEFGELYLREFFRYLP